MQDVDGLSGEHARSEAMIPSFPSKDVRSID